METEVALGSDPIGNGNIDQHVLDTLGVDECLNKGVVVEENIKVPEVGMAFDSIDDLVKYYVEYGNGKGFPVKKRSSAKGEDGQVNCVVIACARSGIFRSKSKNAFKMRPTSKTNCKAMIRATLCHDQKWRLTSVTIKHNHNMSPEKSRYYKKNRIMKAYVKRRLEMNDRAGIRPNKQYNSFLVQAGGHKNVPFTEKDVYNYINKVRQLRLGVGDASALQNYFLKMQANNSNFFYLMDLDDDGRLKNVFWADARSRAAYEEFGDVITFDTTYLTNKYDMPFAPFVGVNHHGQSILLGCGLLSNENIETFTWLFNAWLACMDGRAPSAIITDQDKAMQKAIEVIFPKTHHRWCLWHIMKKLPEKLRGYKEYDSIKYAMKNAVYDSLTPEEFERSWNGFTERFKIQDSSWLQALYYERRRWVPAFVKDCFWAGMSSTQRSESMHAFFDGYVTSRTTLKQFVEQYENALRSKVQKENPEDFNSFNSWIPCITHFDIEKQCQDAYTTSKFKEFQTELTGKLYCEVISFKEECACHVYDISEVMSRESPRQATFTVCFDPNNGDLSCNCRLFEFSGILCRHAIIVMLQKKIQRIPQKYILRRWRKDVKRRHTKVKIIYSDWTINPENERFDRMCNAFYEAIDVATDSEDKTKMVMQWIKGLATKLKERDGDFASSQEMQLESSQAKLSSTSGDVNNLAKEKNNVRSPMAVRSKGRPPSKRKQGTLEKVVKNIKEKKEKEDVRDKEKVKKKEAKSRNSKPSQGGSVEFFTQERSSEFFKNQAFETGHGDFITPRGSLEVPSSQVLRDSRMLNSDSQIGFFEEYGGFTTPPGSLEVPSSQVLQDSRKLNSDSQIGFFEGYGGYSQTRGSPFGAENHYLAHVQPPNMFHGVGFPFQVQQVYSYPFWSGLDGRNSDSNLVQPSSIQDIPSKKNMGKLKK